MKQAETIQHFFRLQAYTIAQQQRFLRKLASQQRAYAAGKPAANAKENSAGTYDFLSRVRLSRQARAVNLFRAFLKGTPYKYVEEKTRPTTYPLVPSVTVENGVETSVDDRCLFADYLGWDLWIDKEYGDKLLEWISADAPDRGLVQVIKEKVPYTGPKDGPKKVKANDVG